MYEFEFDVRYSKEDIRALTKVQANAFCWKQTMALLVFGLVLIGIAAAFLEHGRLAMTLLAFGCWLCVSIHYPAQYLARQICRGMKGKEAGFVYRFGENGVEIRCGQDRNQISYEQIQKIVDAREGLCFFLTKNAGFLIPIRAYRNTYSFGAGAVRMDISKSKFENKDSRDAFKHFLEQRTSIPVETDIPVLLRLLCFRVQRKQKGNV